jgi:hypothetical protein
MKSWTSSTLLLLVSTSSTPLLTSSTLYSSMATPSLFPLFLISRTAFRNYVRLQCHDGAPVLDKVEPEPPTSVMVPC